MSFLCSVSLFLVVTIAACQTGAITFYSLPDELRRQRSLCPHRGFWWLPLEARLINQVLRRCECATLGDAGVDRFAVMLSDADDSGFSQLTSQHFLGV